MTTYLQDIGRLYEDEEEASKHIVLEYSGPQKRDKPKRHGV